jgi:hypothetical protein
MMRHPWKGSRLLIFVLPFALLAVAGCSGDAGETDTGGVEIVVGEFDGLPSLVSVNAVADPLAGIGLVTVDTLDIDSLIENPGAPTSDLQTVVMDTYEVRYTRADAGTRVPTPLVERVLGTIPPGGDVTYDNLPILRAEQLLNPPLSDLLFLNGGFDTETGSDVIRLNFNLRFFGRTVGGRDIATPVQSFTVELVP